MKPRVLVLVKRTSYRTFVLEGKDARTIRLLKEKDPTVTRLRASHDSHEATVSEVHEALEKLGVTSVVRVGPEKEQRDGFALVVTVGGDGTLLVASHQISEGTPLVGINSAPDSSVGFFCAGKRGTALKTLRAALEGKLSATKLTRMRVACNGKVLHERVLNDALFCHASPAATSRYILTTRQADGATRSDEQRSSGVWVGPAAGSTAAQRSAGGRVLPLSSTALQFVVREPYVRQGKKTRLALGLVREGGELEIRSKMRDARLYLDGVHNEHKVHLGDVLTMRQSDDQLVVLGLRKRK